MASAGGIELGGDGAGLLAGNGRRRDAPGTYGRQCVAAGFPVEIAAEPAAEDRAENARPLQIVLAERSQWLEHCCQLAQTHAARRGHSLKTGCVESDTRAKQGYCVWGTAV